MFSPLNRRSAAALVAGLVLAAHAVGQSPPTVDAPAAARLPETRSPQATLRAFQRRMAADDKRAAAELLDLSGLTAESAAAKGPELAYKLFETMRWLVDWPEGRDWPPADDDAYTNVPDDPDADSPWLLSQLERYPSRVGDGIELERGPDGGWRFTADTVAQIDRLYADAEAAAERAATLSSEASTPDDANAAQPTPTFSIWFRNLFPPALRQQRFLLPDYQWVCLLLIAIVGRVIERALRSGMTVVADFVLRRSEPDFGESSAPVWKPVGRLANAATWYGAARAIGLPLDVINVLLMVLLAVTVFAAFWASFAVIDLVKGYLSRRALRTEQRYDELVIPLAATTLKVLTLIAGVIALVAAFSDELPTALLGGLGIGGVAIVLASQETLSNFFGSVAVLLDRPFQVGDWIVVEGLEGEIEAVGFRTTKLRTGMNSQVTIPNSKLAAAAIDNWGRRKYRRYLTRLGVEYGTDPETVEAFCEGIRELIRRHPHTRKDFYAAYFNEFGASALEVLLVVFFVTPDWATELRERHRLLADIARLAKRLGVEFAFPTQTVHLHRGGRPAGAAPPDDLDGVGPDRAGQVAAAEIAGELLNYQDRPGRVKFPGPTPIDPPVG